jgi:hypothetical protein
MSSGKSKDQKNKFGVRRVVNGKELAPRSVRRKTNKRLLSECNEIELEKAKIR